MQERGAERERSVARLTERERRLIAWLEVWEKTNRLLVRGGGRRSTWTRARSSSTPCSTLAGRSTRLTWPASAVPVTCGRTPWRDHEPMAARERPIT